MARQYQGSGGTFINETGTRQYQSSNGTFINETSGAAGATINLTAADTTFGLTSGTGVVTVTPGGGGTVNLAAANTTFALTSGTGAVSVVPPAGTVTSDEFRNYSNILQTAVTVPYVTFLSMTGAVVLQLTNQVTNGAGKLVITNAALTVGTSYMMATFDPTDSNANTMKRGLKKVTAA